MIRACAWHPAKTGKVMFMGQKEPFNDGRLTHGVCFTCLISLKLETLENMRNERYMQLITRYMVAING